MWYRKFAFEKALELRLLGTVQNLPTGEVLIHATGTEEQLKAMEEWCWKGSPLSKVTTVLSSEVATGSYPDFKILE